MYGLILFVLTIICSTRGEMVLLDHGPPPAREPRHRSSEPEWGTITQRVDNFNAADNRTWTMRYLSNSEFFQDGGPIFIFIGGEWTISPGWLMSGLMFDMASDHNGYMFYTEHRYYGESWPTEDFSAENLRYLSADQALVDLVYFIQYVKENIAGLQNSSVVVVGASYAGTLATWGRKKYPHIIDIGYSSSGPVYAKEDFYEYYQVVEDNLGLASPTCPLLIRSALAQVQEMITTEEGAFNVSSIFNTCYLVNTTEPYRSYFFSSLVTPFAAVTQSASEGALKSVCDLLESFEGSDVEKLASFVSSYYTSCIDSYDTFIEYYSTVNLTTDMYRQWLFQTCTEYGWYQTKAFGDTFGVDLYYQMCEDLYGEQFGSEILDVGVLRTNTIYGGFEPEVTQLVSVHGTGDPWHPMGVLKDLNPLAPAIVVNGTSHCKDLYSISETDSDEMREAKLRIKQLIATWLAGDETETITPNPSSNAANKQLHTVALITILSLFFKSLSVST